MIKWKLVAALPLITLNGGAHAQAPEAREGTPPRLTAGAISNHDYPAAAIQAREQGSVRIELSIGADGAVANCAVITSSESEALDNATCAIARERFRFSPGRNADGVATPSVYRQSVRWVLPEQLDGNPFTGFSVALRADLRDGEIVSCTGESEGEGELVDLAPCRAMIGRWPNWDVLRMGLTSASHLFAFAPEGVTLPAHPPEWGELHMKIETELVIGPDGRVLGCGMPGREIQRPCPGGALPVPQFESSSQPERRGRLTMGLFGVAKP